MKYSLFLLFAVCITACINNTLVIEGKLPSDNYDNEWVYWVPMKGASAETVDSACIHKDAFRIILSAHNRNKMGVVRVRHQLRSALQDIIVFAETGTLQLKLDSVSSATGTPLNEALQNWKDRKRKYDREIYVLKQKRKAADANDEAGIKEAIENASAVYYNDIFQIVVENKDNEVGKFIFSLSKSSFTPEQILLIKNNSKSNNKNE